MTAPTAPNPTPLAWLMPWINQRALSPKSQDFQGSAGLREELAMVHSKALTALANDHDTRARLARIEQDLSVVFGPENTEAQIRTFLVDACWICSRHIKKDNDNRMTKSDRSRTVKKLTALASKIDNVASELRTLQGELGRASLVDYLRARHVKGNPARFALERKGYIAAQYDKDGGDRLEDLLTSLSCDIREEIADRQMAIRARRQTGSSQSKYHELIDLLATATKALSVTRRPSADPVLIAVVIDVLVQPDIPIDIDMIRKRLR